jgi:hypothetical protein
VVEDKSRSAPRSRGKVKSGLDDDDEKNLVPDSGGAEGKSEKKRKKDRDREDDGGKPPINRGSDGTGEEGDTKKKRRKKKRDKNSDALETKDGEKEAAYSDDEDFEKESIEGAAPNTPREREEVPVEVDSGNVEVKKKKKKEKKDRDDKEGIRLDDEEVNVSFSVLIKGETRLYINKYLIPLSLHYIFSCFSCRPSTLSW